MIDVTKRISCFLTFVLVLLALPVAIVGAMIGASLNILSLAGKSLFKASVALMLSVPSTSRMSAIRQGQAAPGLVQTGSKSQTPL